MLKKPVVTEVRTPTNTWSGLGFSKSMPAETIKELRRANHVPYKPSMSTTYEVSPAPTGSTPTPEPVGSDWSDRPVDYVRTPPLGLTAAFLGMICCRFLPPLTDFLLHRGQFALLRCSRLQPL